MGKKVRTWKEFWDVLATSRDPIAATDKPSVSPSTYQLYSTEIMQKLALNPEDNVLDIGCGPGIIDVSLAPHVRCICAVDYSHIMARRARANTATCGSVHVMNCDATALPFKNAVFSKLVMYSVAQYLSPDQIDQALGEIKRVTQPGGMIMLGEIFRVRDVSLLNRIRDVWVHQGLWSIVRKTLNRSFKFWLRVTGRFTHRFVRPKKDLPIVLHPEEALLTMVHQHNMRGRVLPQSEKLPWFHQTFDLLIENAPALK